jgi:hypothetical protein
MERNIRRKKMEIDQRSDESVYITIGDWVFYIDNSTDEQIVEKWKEKEHDG